MTATVTERAAAKVNLWLEVLGRRPDGYHELETVMHEVDLEDLVELSRRRDSSTLVVEGAAIAADESNLAFKALRALEAKVGRSLPTALRLVKRIPAGGGLGGGSSDAAAVLRGLVRLHDLDLGPEELEEVAAGFGSDTAFFVRGGTAMCRGRGERLEALEPPSPLDLVLVLPGLHVPTPAVFRALELTVRSRQPYDFLTALRANDPIELRARLFNRLEEPARKLHPELGRILDHLAAERAILSGSGSTIFCLCASGDEAEALAGRVHGECGLETRVVVSARR
ncbi:MAG: 4-(cytidine 5'-diphospho)-2-C-methyl-D-erythritol kinase [Planctomycetes bacterium]|nr:4-(cytidine 5'-diphospho)-2-C-methyl-D-erythritol kinase [Planctomycetota bacterium]